MFIGPRGKDLFSAKTNWKEIVKSGAISGWNDAGLEFKFEASFLQVQIITYVICYQTQEMLPYFHAISPQTIIILQCEFNITTGNILVSDMTIYHYLNQRMPAANWWPNFPTPRKVQQHWLDAVN